MPKLIQLSLIELICVVVEKQPVFNFVEIVATQVSLTLLGRPNHFKPPTESLSPNTS